MNDIDDDEGVPLPPIVTRRSSRKNKNIKNMNENVLFAERIDAHTMMYSQPERGSRSKSYPNLVDIVDATDVDIDMDQDDNMDEVD